MGVLVNIAEVGISLCVIVLVAVSPGRVKKLREAGGEVIRNSVSEKVFVTINGVKMGMFIKSKDTSFPVLLLIHGGPGMPEYFLSDDYPTGLDDYFTVVWWDQRGAGLSFSNNIDQKTMTSEQFVEDTIGVTNYLRERFGQGKIYLMAHSWGSFIGIQAAQKAPELYNAYIGVGQMTNQVESERLAYEYMKNYFKRSGDQATADWLEDTTYLAEAYKKKRDSLMHKAGIGTTHHMKSVVTGIFFRSLSNTEYSLAEKINLWRGKIFSSKMQLQNEEYTTDIREKVKSLEIPVYFFSGAYDYTVNFAMSRDYLQELDAPKKAFYLFEHSAHSPIFEEPDKVRRVFREDILKG